MAITARSENPSSDIVDLEHVLIHFISENDHSVSVLVISRVKAVTRRRSMFGKASSSQAQLLVKGCLEAPYLLTARVFPTTNLISKGFGKWNYFLQEQHAFYFTDHPAAVPYLL